MPAIRAAKIMNSAAVVFPAVKAIAPTHRQPKAKLYTGFLWFALGVRHKPA